MKNLNTEEVELDFDLMQKIATEVRKGRTEGVDGSRKWRLKVDKRKEPKLKAVAKLISDGWTADWTMGWTLSLQTE